MHARIQESNQKQIIYFGNKPNTAYSNYFIYIIIRSGTLKQQKSS